MMHKQMWVYPVLVTEVLCKKTRGGVDMAASVRRCCLPPVGCIQAESDELHSVWDSRATCMVMGSAYFPGVYKWNIM